MDFAPEAPWWTDPTAGTFPSFVHGLATALLLGALPLSRRSRFALLGAHLASTLGLEATLGTPDPRDALALLLGTTLAFATGGTGRKHGERRGAGSRGTSLVLGVPAVLCSAALTVGSYEGLGADCALYSGEGHCEAFKRAASPVYMDYATLRNAIEVRGPRPLDRIGQLYAFGDHLFVGERQQGVHVIDNTDPAAPVNVAFVRIPGNTEIAIRGRHLYADSYVDLVTLDIGDPHAVRLVDRQVDVFPWDASQSIPYDIGFESAPDPNLGVVVTYDEL